MYILFVIYFGSGIASMEFENHSNCLAAKARIESMQSHSGLVGVCLKK